jgi:subtilase family serine protease
MGVRAAPPFQREAAPAAVDLGPLAASVGTPVTFTVVLNLSDVNAAEQLLTSISTPGDPQYRKFLTTEEFVSRFAPPRNQVAHVIAGLAKLHLTAVQATATTLRVSGAVADVERAFSVNLHNYQVAAQGGRAGYTFHAPTAPLSIPAEIAGTVSGVVGLDSSPRYHPHMVNAPMKGAASRQVLPQAGTTNPPGLLTTSDFAQLYDVSPLYTRGIQGHGRTIGIMSLASFTPSDAFLYWSLLGLTVDPNRITVINVDGGPGAPSDASGSEETTLDVEQSGGIAPAAKMLVYLAPNTTQGFVDLFAAAIDDNSADSLSISWGEWELLDTKQFSPAVDPFTHKIVSTTQAVHELLVRAALQGQTVTTSAGDGGAYEINRDFGCIGPFDKTQPFSCSLTLSVDYPASDPAITAVGGTTLPGTMEFCLNAACTPPFFAINIPQERVWGWDYLEPLCTALGFSFASCGIEFAGGGGGVSVAFQVPFYQFGLAGVQESQPGVVFKAGAGFTGSNLTIGVPGLFPGRNVPDVSFNSDPETGYIIIYTSSSGGLREDAFIGGTSFAAPQLNGVSALLGEQVHSRLGLLNFPLYLTRFVRGSAQPLNVISQGDNWFYQATDGYSPAAGLGTMDVTKFADFLSGP